METTPGHDAPAQSRGRGRGAQATPEEWRRLLDLVDEAADVPLPARGDWLQGLALPAHLVPVLRRLLDDQTDRQAGFLADLPALSATRSMALGRLSPGTMVGAWRILRRIGEGGMSTVWLAERADGQVVRRAALKLPHAGPGQEMLARRMLRERNILAGLEHRHIARLYDVGVTADGVPYLVMEYVEGDSLLAHADARRWTVMQRLSIFRQALSAVQYAHGKLILHRDLKPPNILVNAEAEVKLLDFGIAKLMAPTVGTAAATELTQAVGGRLTPAYASPEQLRGGALETTSDVYSLGMILYELLCGHRPYDMEGLTLAGIEQAILAREPRPMARQQFDAEVASARSTTPAALRRMLAGDLSAVVLKALAKTPQRRYATVEALDADVARWISGRPVSAHAPGRLYLLGKFLDRHRWPAALGTCAVAALVATSTVALLQARAARQEAARAASVRDFLVGMFADTDPNRPDSQELTARTLLENGRRHAVDRLESSPGQMGELLTYIGNAQVNISDNTGAERTFVQALEAYRRSGDERGRLLVLLARIDNALDLGRVDEAWALTSDAASMMGPWRDDAFMVGTLLRERGYVAGFRYDFAAQRDLLRAYLRLADAHPGMPALDRVQVLQNLATAASHLEDLPAALGYVDEAQSLLRAHPELPVAARFDVSAYRQDILFQWGRYAEIEADSPRQSRECDRTLNPISQICMKLKIRLQASRLRLGLVDEALAQEPELATLLNPSSPREQLVAAAAIARALARAGTLSSHPERMALLVQLTQAAASAELTANYQLQALNALAEIDLLADRPQDALDPLARAERLAAASKGLNDAEMVRLQALKGVALQQQGHAAAALEAMKPLCDADRPLTGRLMVQTHYLRLDCVPALVAQGEVDAAIGLLAQTLPVLRSQLGPESPTVRFAEGWLGGLRSTRTLPTPQGAVQPVFD